MRLIDADALQREYMQFHDGKRSVLVDVAPTIEPERKKGKWIYAEHDIAMCDGYRCDQCGFFVPWDYKYKFIDFIKDYHWCPSCGADMRGEE